MNQEIKKLWIEKLRSGEYTKIKNALARVNNCRCASAVLIDIFIEQNQGKQWELKEGRLRFEDKAFLLPVSIVSWAGLSEDQEEYIYDLNDKKNYSFEQIAGIIEKEF